MTGLVLEKDHYGYGVENKIRKWPDWEHRKQLSGVAFDLDKDCDPLLKKKKKLQGTGDGKWTGLRNNLDRTIRLYVMFGYLEERIHQS